MSFPAMSIAEAHARLTAPGSPFEIEEIEIGGARMRVWKTAPATTRTLLAIARGHGERTFLVLDDERVSFDGFHRATAAFARALVEAGVCKGDRVAIAMRNLPEWAVAFFAASSVGAIVTPLNGWWTTAELDYALADSGAAFAVVDAERLARIVAGDAASGLRRIYVVRADGEVGGARRLKEIIGPPAAWPALPDDDLPGAELAAEDDATIFYTSGTNGRPKGALGSHRNILSNIIAAASAAARVHLRRGEPVPTPAAEPQGGALLTVPLFHVTGCLAILAPCLYAGSKLVLMRRWDAERAIFLIAQERLSWWIGVPAMVLQLIEHPSRERFDLSCLASLGYGGSAAPPELARRIAEALPGATAGHGWGMTETSGLATTHSAEDYANRPGSCGPPVAVGEVKITRAGTDESLPPGEIGELWYRGPQVVKGYWRDPVATRAAFVAGWVRTGDLARMDAEGFVSIVDRLKDVVIRGGENIYCVEVENALAEHPAVLEAALVARPHRVLGEEPVAFVTLRPGRAATDPQLRAFLQSRLAPFKVPASFEIRTEPLPRNLNGKLLKAELRQALAWEGSDVPKLA
ncbi:class I adenylate-forming enzyme family protein [Phenylobacterium sp. LjRoot225]|uniref:class I adenylate-forming enzyme family protein n=1 Tax=Phenylobacterium sp. LjRoot225 TaxID=3342285 RepID=UPI003ED16AF2